MATGAKMATCACGKRVYGAYGARCPDCVIVRVELDATEPGELLEHPTPPSVTLANIGDGPNGFAVIAITGWTSEVREFVDRWWGLEDLPDWDDLAVRVAS